ncbi:MAG: hypothetical protein WAM28_07185 [Chlamydiales bacterium]
MRGEGKTLLKALLTRSQREPQLIGFLPDKLAKEIKSASHPQKLDFAALLSLSEWLKPIHYSWFIPFLQNLPEKTLAVFLSVFNPVQVKGISEMLKKEMIPLPLSPFSTPFLIKYLKTELEEGKIIGSRQLLFSDMMPLLQLKREELLNLIDLLGIYDLAADLRQVVDKELLGKIHTALSHDQLQFLHYCSKQPSKWVSPKLGLSGWDGTKKTLNSILHQRGLTWLARAIIEESASFHWHLLHHLDTGRANVVQKVFKQKQDLVLTKYFKNQVLHIARRFQTAA